MNAMRQAHADGWFIVFDTLTLADDRLEAFYDNPNALRESVRSEERFSRNAETELVCRLLLEKRSKGTDKHHLRWAHGLSVEHTLGGDTGAERAAAASRA